MKTVFRYVGGPLDGQVAQPRGYRYSTYRHDDGSTMPTGWGDHRFLRSHTRPSSGYVKRGDAYLHASVLAARLTPNT